MKWERWVSHKLLWESTKIRSRKAPDGADAQETCPLTAPMSRTFPCSPPSQLSHLLLHLSRSLKVSRTRLQEAPFSGPTHGGGCSFPVLEMHDADCFSVLKSWTYLSCFFNWTLSPLATKFPPQVSCTPHRAWLSLLHRVAQLKYS